MGYLYFRGNFCAFSLFLGRILNHVVMVKRNMIEIALLNSLLLQEDEVFGFEVCLVHWFLGSFLLTLSVFFG